jgi:hypothetical protein
MDFLNQFRRELVLHLAGVSFEGQPMGRHFTIAALRAVLSGSVPFRAMALPGHLAARVLEILVVIRDDFNANGAVAIACGLLQRHAFHADQASLPDLT